MKKSESIAELAKAFVRAQMSVIQPFKDKANPFFKSKYVPLENVVDSITKAFAENGIGYSQWPSQDEQGNVTVGTIIFHTSGEWMEYDPIILKPVKNDPQSHGSAITYGKRYALSAIFGITSDQDDDGNNASISGSKNNNKAIEYVSEGLANTYRGMIVEISESKGKQVESVSKWFLDKLGVVDYRKIAVNQVEFADRLINMLNEKEVKDDK